MVRVIEGDCEDRAEMGGERGGEREREELEDAMPPTLMMKEGATSQGKQAPLESEKARTPLCHWTLRKGHSLLHASHPAKHKALVASV